MAFTWQLHSHHTPIGTHLTNTPPSLKISLKFYSIDPWVFDALLADCTIPLLSKCLLTFSYGHCIETFTTWLLGYRYFLTRLPPVRIILVGSKWYSYYFTLNLTMIEVEDLYSRLSGNWRGENVGDKALALFQNISRLLDISRYKKYTDDQQKCLILVQYSLFSYPQ